MSADRTSAGKSCDRLVYHCLEDRSREVFFGRTFVDQRLKVALGENTAAGCDRIKRRIGLRHLIQAVGIRTKERSHLINESTRTTGTGTVHALFRYRMQIRDLRILSAEFDDNIGLRVIFRDRHGLRDDFLNKIQSQPLGHGKSAGTRDLNTCLQTREFFIHLFERA